MSYRIIYSSQRFNSCYGRQSNGGQPEPTTIAVIHAKAINRIKIITAIDSFVSERFLLSKKASLSILWSRFINSSSSPVMFLASAASQ